jgi:hypothetical protein
MGFVLAKAADNSRKPFFGFALRLFDKRRTFFGERKYNTPAVFFVKLLIIRQNKAFNQSTGGRGENTALKKRNFPKFPQI